MYAKAAGSNQQDISKAHKELRKDLPVYSMDEVGEHNSPKTGIWVTYGIGVYDITTFVPKHPGSDKVMLAAGNIILFWNCLHVKLFSYKITRFILM